MDANAYSQPLGNRLNEELQWIVHLEVVLITHQGSIEELLIIKWHHLLEFEVMWEPITRSATHNSTLRIRWCLRGAGIDEPPQD